MHRQHCIFYRFHNRTRGFSFVIQHAVVCSGSRLLNTDALYLRLIPSSLIKEDSARSYLLVRERLRYELKAVCPETNLSNPNVDLSECSQLAWASPALPSRVSPPPPSESALIDVRSHVDQNF